MLTYTMHLTQSGSASEDGLYTYAGRSDAPLSAHGTEGLHILKKDYAYPAVEKVYASPLQRCGQTADILYPGVPVELVDDLTAYHMGSFQGKAFQELKDDPDFRNHTNNPYRHAPPGGEDLITFTARCITAIHTVYTRMAQQDERNVAVLTHARNISFICHSICLPRRPMHTWGTANGAGYTLLITPHLWERDGLAEIYSIMPGDDIALSFDTYWRNAD